MEALGGIRTKSEIADWIGQHYPNRWKPGTLSGHLYGCSINNPKGIEHHASFPRFLFAHGNSRYELYDQQRHGTYENGVPAGEGSGEQVLGSNSAEASEAGSAAFAYESHLRDYLARNLQILEPGLSLWGDEQRDSVEFAIEGRRIDILARDVTGCPVIVELKVSRGHERTIGQCLLYRARLKQQGVAERVRIFVVAEEISEELKLAAQEVADLTLFEYRLAMTVRLI